MRVRPGMPDRTDYTVLQRIQLNTIKDTMIPMTKVCGQPSFPSGFICEYDPGQKEVKRLEKEIEEGLARKSKIKISG